MAHRALRLVRSDIARHLVRFTAVGALGFGVNATVLWTLTRVLHVPFYLGQLVGAELALLSNFALHDGWTFDHIAKLHASRKMRLALYHGSFAFGMGINSIVTIGVHYLWRLPALPALAAGSAAALGVNFLTSRFLVWRPRTVLGEE